jgi:Tol biopolymer transport system component
MPNIDDLLTRELERAGRPAAPDLGHVEKEVRRRRARRGVVRRVQAGALAVAVLAATIGGFVTLSRLFETGDTPTPRSGPFANGQLLVATSEGLQLVDPSTGEAERLTTPDIRGDVWKVSFSPDGSEVALTVFADPGPRAIWVAEADLSDAREVAAAENVSRASWSADGSELIYVAHGPDGSAIHIVGTDGSDDRIVGDTIPGGNRTYFSPTFSPDGSQIAFAMGTDAEFAIFVMNSDGSNARRLAEAGNAYDLAWSPDGSQIAFTVQEAAMESDIFVMGADGGDVHRLTDGGPNVTNLSAVWSPDSQRIAYALNGGNGEGGLVVMDRDGSDATEVLPEGTGVLGISWQPVPAGSTATPVDRAVEGRDIGLGFRVCFDGYMDPMRRIDFLGDGTAGSAWVGVPVKEDGTCPSHARPSADILAVDHTGDQLADAWIDLGVRCDVLCAPFDSVDLDGNGTEELVVASHFSIMSYYFFSLRSDQAGDLSLEPIRVAPPGHEPADIGAGERLRIDAGGDEGYGSSIRCEGYPQDPVIVWAWRFGAVDSNAPQEVHETRIELKSDGLFHVVGTNDSAIPPGEPGPVTATAPACGVDWHPNA